MCVPFDACMRCQACMLHPAQLLTPQLGSSAVPPILLRRLHADPHPTACRAFPACPAFHPLIPQQSNWMLVPGGGRARYNPIDGAELAAFMADCLIGPTGEKWANQEIRCGAVLQTGAGSNLACSIARLLVGWTQQREAGRAVSCSLVVLPA